MPKNFGRFGTFEGVFTPAILTIIGVILYLRLGWVIGSVGILGAVLIIVLAHIATITTGLSMASMATNVRLGAGGFYALISNSLGLEVGGAIGFPLYLSQAFGTTLYITGFTEVWVSLFPHHNFHLVASLVLLFLLIISYISAKIAIKIQYVIMAIIAFSLIGFFLSPFRATVHVPLWLYRPEESFWKVFAIFFPAVTGIGSGAAMSGELKNPRRSIPVGILSAIGIGLIVYLVTAYWLTRVATPAELQSNYMIMVKTARWPWAVIAGIMGATISSALGTLVGAPRILMALAQDKIIPYEKELAAQSKNGEPRNAILLTGILVEMTLLLFDLNGIASLLTIFFLITYAMINLSVAIEKAIGIPSFRPSFNIPLSVPLLGSLWCTIVMFLINPIFAFVAQVFIFILYYFFVKQGVRSAQGDVRSGLFNEIAELAAKTAARMPKGAKTWKPNLMIPVEDPKNWSHVMEFIRDLVAPKGTLRMFSVKIVERGVETKIEQMVLQLFHKRRNLKSSTDEHSTEELREHLNQLVLPVRKEGIFTAATVIESHDFLEGMSIITQVMLGIFFPPNVFFLSMSADRSKDRRLEELIAIGLREKVGLAILSLNPRKMFGEKRTINVWLRTRSPNINLALLLGIQLRRNWNGTIRLFSVAPEESDKNQIERFLNRVMERGRLPSSTEIFIPVGNFIEFIKNAPGADINVFGMSGELSCEVMHTISERIQTSCLFLRDSGEESAFA